jgi:hypothetical protein
MSPQAPRRRRRPADLPPGPDDWTVADGDEPTLRSVEGPTLLSGELAKVARRPGWGERLGAVRVWAAWDDMVGSGLAAHCEPVRLAGKVLVVRAESPAWATQLRYLTAQLIERADIALGPGSVREVRVVVGSLEGQRAAGGGADAGSAAPSAAVRHTVRTDLSGGSSSSGSSSDPRQGPAQPASPDPEASR